MRIVLDTNVLVSALLKQNSKPSRILEMALRGDVTILLDERILAEYYGVLSRPKFDIPLSKTIEVLGSIGEDGERILAFPLEAKLPDIDDLLFLEVAVTGGADALVTGNKKDFPPDRRHGVKVLTPAEFLDWMDTPRR